MKFSIITFFLTLVFALVVVAMPGRGDHVVTRWISTTRYTVVTRTSWRTAYLGHRYTTLTVVVRPRTCPPGSTHKVTSTIGHECKQTTYTTTETTSKCTPTITVYTASATETITVPAT